MHFIAGQIEENHFDAAHKVYYAGFSFYKIDSYRLIIGRISNRFPRPITYSYPYGYALTPIDKQLLR
jgi:hypothetical protein